MKFLKLAGVLLVFACMWGANSFVFADSVDKPYISYTPQDIHTHIIPLIQIDGQLVRAEDLMEVISVPINN
jgi:hypothetical protein